MEYALSCHDFSFFDFSPPDLILSKQGNVLRGDAAHAKLAQLKEFSEFLMSITEAAFDKSGGPGTRSDDEESETYCCICYACDADAIFEPCHHRSCYGCITRHLLNSPRCFFCNTAVTEVVRIFLKDQVTSSANSMI